MGDNKQEKSDKTSGTVKGSIKEEEIILALGKKQIELGILKEKIEKLVLESVKVNNDMSLNDIRQLYFGLYVTTDDIVKFKMVEKHGKNKA